MKGNGNLIGPRLITSLENTSGKFDLYDQYVKSTDAVWPAVKEVSVSTNVTNVLEGQDLYINVETTGYPVGYSLTYSIVATSGQVLSSDFVDGLTSNTFTVNSGTTQILKQIARDAGNELNERFEVRIYDGGTLMATSPEVTITDPIWSIVPQQSSYNEGQTPLWTVTWSNVYPGQHYFTYSGTAGNSSDINSTSTSWYVSSTSGSTVFSFPTILEDYITEGTETLFIFLRANSVSGPVVAGTNINVNDTSIDPVATITPSTSNINEGASVTFNISMTNFASGTLNWDTVLSADMEESDIDVISGTVTISNSTGSVSITATSDGYTETGQTENFSIRVYHPTVSSTVIGSSSAVTINDTSTGTPEPTGPPPIDITSQFYEFSNRQIDSNVYMGNSNDYSGPYDVADICTNFVGNGRIYIGIKVTTTPTFYNDICIAGVQHLDNSGSTLLNSWIFYNSSGGSGSTWQTSYARYNGSSTIGFYSTPSFFSTELYTSITTAQNVDRFTWETRTGSSYTGCLDGISSGYNTTILPAAGNGVVPQSSSAYYAYRETSGSARYSSTVMRSPIITFSGNDIIRVAHAVAGYSLYPMDPNDSLYIGVY